MAKKEKVIRISEEPQKKEMSATQIAAADLLNAKTQNQPLTMHVTGIEPIKTKEGGGTEMMPVCMYHGWKIVIPRSEFMTTASLVTVESADELTNRIYRYNGAEIDIIPLAFMVDDQVCVASRKKAMEVKMRDFWFKKEGKEYILQPGRKVEARVVNVVRGAVFIEVFGVETGVRAAEVAYYRIDNCRKKYKAGDKVFVIIKEVERDEELQSIKFEASIKEAQSDPRQTAFQRYVRGGVYDGVVTMINTNPEKTDRSGAFVRLGKDEEDRIDVYCRYPKGVNPLIGDRVSVGINDKDLANLRIWGNILHIERQE